MKSIIMAAFFFITASQLGISQNVQIKKDVVYLEDQKILQYEKYNLAEYSLKNLNGDEILYFQIKTNPETQQSYLVFNFIEQKAKINSTSVSRVSALGVKNMMEKMLTWLIKDGVIQKDGSINLDKLEIFAQKFDDYRGY